MSRLLIRCPLKPFAGALTGSAGEWEDLACAHRFEWCLVEDDDDVVSASSALMPTTQSGIGSIDAMPYADEALVLLPTLDVRLIETKVPLANPKKLQAILPTLVEEYVLSNTASLHIIALPPLHGQPAMDRSLAVIDRAWYSWIINQLQHLLAHRVRLIPDCLLLALPGEVLGTDSTSPPLPTLMYAREGDAMVYCQRTGIQTGVAWAESCVPNTDQQRNIKPDDSHSAAIPLPSHVGATNAVLFSWAWAIPSSIAFLEANASSRSPHFALNLLPAGFKSRAGGLAPSTHTTSDAPTRNAIALAWVDPMTWQSSLRWLGLGMAAIALGFIAQLAWLGVSNWRWGQQMELLAMQSLTPANISKLSSATNDYGVLPVFLDQMIRDQRSQGAVTDADFSSLAAKLQQLSSALNVQSLQQIYYSANAMEFEFKAGTPDYSSHDAAMRVVSSARNLGLLVKHLGGTRYRLESYAGLGTQP